MSEVLFILTTLYVAYVVYNVTEESKRAPQTSKSSSTASILTPTGATTSAPAVEAPVTAVKKSEAVAEVKTEVKVKEQQPEKVQEVESKPVSSSDLRDPATGETAKVTNNYRGLKRWLKQALVTEGLLEKVYSNNELNDETNAKIKEALEAIKLMPKYRA